MHLNCGKYTYNTTKIILFRFTRNILPYASINTYSSSGRADGPLLETHSLTCRQPRGSQVLSTQRFYPPTTARPKVYLYLHIGRNISLQLAILKCAEELHHFNEVFIYLQFSTCCKNYYKVYNHLLGSVRTT